jgi:DDE superfamily endonuclease
MSPSPRASVPPLSLLTPFAVAFTAPTFRHALVLVSGTILASGRRTVASALRAVGLGDERRVTTYHRVLNRGVWSGLVLSRVLLGLLVRTFLAPDAPLELVVDGTLERRRGRKVAWKGRFHDATRSQSGHVVTSDGIHWVCVMLLAPVPWSRRRWALPFLAIPTFTPAISAKLGKVHRTAPERTEGLVRLIRRWQPHRIIHLVGDSGFAVLRLAHVCGAVRVRLISRLVLNAQLYDPPRVRPTSTPGVKPKKGPRQPKLVDRLDAATLAAGHTTWQRQVVAWYGHQRRLLDVATGTALWHTDGCDPLPIRWILVRDPQGRLTPYALFCTDPAADAVAILAAYLQRWNIEVTFEEARAYLGLETQRQWTTRAVGRTTPCLLGLFSVVVLMAHAAHPDQLPTRQTAWYRKSEATFSDALAAVRRELWTTGANRNAPAPPGDPLLANPPAHLLRFLVDAACYAA